MSNQIQHYTTLTWNQRHCKADCGEWGLYEYNGTASEYRNHSHANLALPSNMQVRHNQHPELRFLHIINPGPLFVSICRYSCIKHYTIFLSYCWLFSLDMFATWTVCNFHALSSIPCLRSVQGQEPGNRKVKDRGEQLMRIQNKASCL